VSSGERRAAIALEEHERGARETTGKNDGPDVRLYANGIEGIHWCGAFASWVCEKAGTPLPGSREDHLAVINIERAARKTGWLLSAHGEVHAGDLLISRREDPKNPNGRHVGIVVAASKRSLLTVDGNISNRVSKVTWSRSNPLIVGVVRIPEPGGIP
jgi:hypothetical protein